jgi:predicted lipase
MYSAGVEFIPEFEDFGFGVRLRERKLKYLKNIGIDRFNNMALIKMEYAGERFLCKISLDTVDDINRTNFQTDKEFGDAISEIMHHILAAAENEAKNGIEDGNVLLTYEMLEPTSR